MSFKVGDKVKCIDNEWVDSYFTIGESYVISNVTFDDHVTFAHTGYTGWKPSRFELIEKESTVKEIKQPSQNLGEKQFNPQPGDKIICVNGEEFTCCTKEYLQETISRHINSNAPILGFHSDDGWNTWLSDGTCGDKYTEWAIREVIPKEQEETKPEVKVEQFTYTAEDILVVFKNWNWSNETAQLFIEDLNKVTSPEYKEYLRLKVMFENEQ